MRWCFVKDSFFFPNHKPLSQLYTKEKELSYLACYTEAFQSYKSTITRTYFWTMKKKAVYHLLVFLKAKFLGKLIEISSSFSFLQILLEL